MALEIKRPQQGAAVGLVADRRLYVTADGRRLVEEGDPSAALLLAATGTMIPQSTVSAMELSIVDGRVVQGKPEPAPEPAPKAAPAPPARSRPRRQAS